MDKKAKKKIETFRQRIQRLRQQLVGAKKQEDEPGEVTRLETEIETLTSVIEKLKAS